MHIAVAAVFTPDRVLGFAAVNKDTLLRTIYTEIVVPRFNGEDRENEVREIASAGHEADAARLWFDAIGRKAGIATQTVTATTELIGYTTGTPEPDSLHLGVAVNPDAVTLIPAVSPSALNAAIYHGFVKDRLTGIKPPEEEMVRDLVSRGDYAGAVQCWFKLVGPKAGYYRLYSLSQVHIQG